ncbi:helix-turn-helix domain-containing protein [Austwickia chelonae]|uniref:helix-turn-helix domain-containing protein n=1 Tax=Austwickia chelonae TaxID=100225 RepID=UPI000E24E979|nr:helix-turn-helix transcriptional regulator [Austwickia chelonae]
MTVIDPGRWASTTPPGGHDMPSPFHGDRLKTLRTERGWSQAELAEKIGSDARLTDLDQLTEDERTTITNVIDALITKSKLRALTGS